MREIRSVEEYLNNKVAELEKHFLSNAKIPDFFMCEKILLFHAAFFHDFPISVAKRINKLFNKILVQKSRIDINEFVYENVSLILLQKLINNEAELWHDQYIHAIVNYIGHHNSANRRIFTFLISFIIDQNLNCDSIKKNLVNQCMKNIKNLHRGNIDNFALITFLNISPDEKRNIFEKLLSFEEFMNKKSTNDHSFDFDDLTNLLQGKSNITNPFFSDFSNILNKINSELDNIEKRKFFTSTILADKRLQKYLRF